MVLTVPQQRVLTAIQDGLKQQGYPPTVRELALRLGVCIGTIQAHLRALERKGAVKRHRFQARGLCLAAPEERAAVGTIREVPLVGRVAAGSPLPTFENLEGFIPVSTEWVKGGGPLFSTGERGKYGPHIV